MTKMAIIKNLYAKSFRPIFHNNDDNDDDDDDPEITRARNV